MLAHSTNGRAAIHLDENVVDEVAMLAANAAWGFNCGPAALCAITGLTPEELRPFLVGFEAKPYLNPTTLRAAVRELDVPFDWLKFNHQGKHQLQEKCIGHHLHVARIQFGGPWTSGACPPRVAYLHTHWIAAYRSEGGVRVFDVNNPAVDGKVQWLPWAVWVVIAKALAGDIQRADGTWWFTHAAAVHW